MSYFEGLSCPVCSKPFASDEDIVVCPHCGLPHHRACWRNVGQCFAHEKHGTSEQWSRENAKTQATPAATPKMNVCPKCATQNAEYAEFCSRCGHPLSAAEWHSTPVQTPPTPQTQAYAPYRVPEEEQYSSAETIDGVPADELAAVVGNNASYYISRFRRMSQGGFGGWNWSAFLLTPFWLLYRKQYLLGVVYFCVLIPAMIALLTLSTALESMVEVTSTSVVDIAAELEQYSFFIPCALLINIYAALMILLALKGNSFYFAQCKKKIRTIKSKTPDITVSELGTLGGTSAGIAILFVSIGYVIAMPLINLMDMIL